MTSPLSLAVVGGFLSFSLVFLGIAVIRLTSSVTADICAKAKDAVLVTLAVVAFGDQVQGHCGPGQLSGS